MRILIAVIAGAISMPSAQSAEGECPAYLSHDVRKLRLSETTNMCDNFAGKALLIVNTASRCGFTPQFSGLETLYQEYKDLGFAIVGVPSDDFRQAAQDEDTAAKVCYINYGVTFTMLSQLKVRGPDAHPIFRELGQRAGEPTWNFNKYLVDREGNVVERFNSSVDPMSERLRDALESIL